MSMCILTKPRSASSNRTSCMPWFERRFNAPYHGRWASRAPPSRNSPRHHTRRPLLPMMPQEWPTPSGELGRGDFQQHWPPTLFLR